MSDYCFALHCFESAHSSPFSMCQPPGPEQLRARHPVVHNNVYMEEF